MMVWFTDESTVTVTNLDVDGINSNRKYYVNLNHGQASCICSYVFHPPATVYCLIRNNHERFHVVSYARTCPTIPDTSHVV